ncbi:MAG: hypothetical protein ACOYNO_08850 [Saprospiraceae bacterium]
MTDFTSPDEQFPYVTSAQDLARRSAIVAGMGTHAKLEYYEAEKILRKWRELMINAPVTLHNTLFIVFAVVELFVSWEVYRDILSNIGFPRLFIPFGVLLLCLLINGWASITAHFIGRGWSKDVQDWERWNYVFIKNNGSVPPGIVDENLEREKKRSRRLAISSGFILFLLVIVSVLYRTLALSSEASDNGTSNQMQLVTMAIVPIVILIGELFTGDFIWYSIRWLQNKRRRNRERKTFYTQQNECGRLDQLSVTYTKNATAKGEQINLQGDLEKAHMRHKFRSLQNDDYMDSFDKQRYIGFTFRSRGNKTPLSNQIVKATLPNGAATGEFITDGQGKVTIRWDGEHDHVVSVILNEQAEWLGPFQATGEHYIEVFEPQNSTNGNGALGQQSHTPTH